MSTKSLFESSRRGNVCKIREILNRSGVDVNARDREGGGMTALMHAVSCGNKEAVEALICRSADVQARDSGGDPVLFHALFKEEGEQVCEEIVTDLLERGVEIDVENDEGVTALHVAATLGDISVISLLLKKGADIDRKDPEGRTPLLRSVTEGFTDVSTFLISQGACVDYPDNKGTTALMEASRAGSANTIALLLERGASVWRTDNFGNTPLDHAKECYQPVAMRRLCEKMAEDPGDFCNQEAV